MNTKLTLTGRLSTGVTSKTLPAYKVLVEFQEEAEVAYTPGTQTQRIAHVKEGYNSYLLHCPQYGIEENLFVYIWDAGINEALIRVTNQGGENVTQSIGTTIWLCVPETSEEP